MTTITKDDIDISKTKHINFELSIDPDGFEVLTKDGDEPERVMVATISSAEVDRDGDRVLPGAFFNLSKGPFPLLWGHDSHSFPVGKSQWIKNDRKNKKVKGKFVFANTPKSIESFDLIKGGFISNVSVGFVIPSRDDMEQNDFGGWDFSKAELLEVSLVNIPANRDAVIDGVKSMMDDGYKFSKSTLVEFGFEKGG